MEYLGGRVDGENHQLLRRDPLAIAPFEEFLLTVS
jgi:hypothetical protein